MAVELAPLGIRVNVIAPGPIETPMVAEVHTHEVRATWLASVPMRRYGTPADIAAAAVFLLDAAQLRLYHRPDPRRRRRLHHRRAAERRGARGERAGVKTASGMSGGIVAARQWLTAVS